MNKMPLPDSRQDLIELHDEIVIRLALIEMNEQSNDMTQQLDEVDPLNFDEAYAAYTQKTKPKFKQLIDKKINKVHAKHFLRHTVLGVARVSAAVLAALSIGVTSAIALIPSVRISVLKMLIDVQEQYTELRLVEDNELSYDVPDEWGGEYFLTYVPDGFSLSTVHKNEYVDTNRVEYQTKDGRILQFTENGEEVIARINTENSENRFVHIRGGNGVLSEGDGYTMISWMHHDRYFVLYLDGNGEEAQKIAEGVIHIR